jgi:hypothetical protein
MVWGVYVKCNDIFIGSKDSYGYYLEEILEEGEIQLYKIAKMITITTAYAISSLFAAF